MIGSPVRILEIKPFVLHARSPWWRVRVTQGADLQRISKPVEIAPPQYRTVEPAHLDTFFWFSEVESVDSPIQCRRACQTVFEARRGDIRGKAERFAPDKLTACCMMAPSSCSAMRSSSAFRSLHLKRSGAQISSGDSGLSIRHASSACVLFESAKLVDTVATQHPWAETRCVFSKWCTGDLVFAKVSNPSSGRRRSRATARGSSVPAPFSMS